MAYSFITDYKCSCGKEFKKVTEKLEESAICWCGEMAGSVKTVDAENYSTLNSNLTVIADIQPYKSMATGEMITSRSKHRTHLKDRGLIEVGNEQPKPRQTEPTKKEREALRYEIAARLDSHR